ncbi:MAG: tetratricopeptide repeat protein, partial [Helicobacter sp.]|nr:tetratricopeptide repeat protein [Helicobacter sp.]
LQGFLKEEPRLLRLILDFLKDFHPSCLWEILEDCSQEEIFQVLDIVWNLNSDQLPNNVFKNPILNDVFQAKGYYSLQEGVKSSFELESICLLHQYGNYQGDLRFNYSCNVCKAISPLAFDRCPHCGELLSIKVLTFLKEKHNEESHSFL